MAAIASDPTVATGIARAGDRTWPAITGTISKPCRANMATRPAASHEAEAPANRGAGAAGRVSTRRTANTASAARGTSFSAVKVVHARAETTMPVTATAARTLTSPAAATPRTAGEAEGKSAPLSPEVTAAALATALTYVTHPTRNEASSPKAARAYTTGPPSV